MATHEKTPIRHVYGVVEPERYKEVRHYHSVEVTGGKPMFSDRLNISKNRNFSKARNVDYWLKERNGNKWGKPITGLKPTSTPFVYFGDVPKKKNGKFIPQHLLLFHFSHDAETLTIYFYADYYPNEMQIMELAALLKMEDAK